MGLNEVDVDRLLPVQEGKHNDPRAFWEQHVVWIVVLAALALVVGIIVFSPPTR